MLGASIAKQRVHSHFQPLAMVLVTMVLTGIAGHPLRAEENPATAAVRKPGGVVAILNEPDLPVVGANSSPQVLGRILESAGLQVHLLSAEELADVLSPGRFDLVVIPTGRTFPAGLRRPFVEYLHEGGAFISTGGYAFTQLLHKSGKQWLPISDAVDRLFENSKDAERNRIPEGGFEPSTDSTKPLGRWSLPRTFLQLVSDAPAEGKHCVRANSADIDANPTFSMNLKPEQNVLYRISGRIRSKEIKGDRFAYLAVYQYDAQGKLLEWKNFGTAHGSTPWTRYEHTFSPAAGATRLHIKGGLFRASGTAWFDDIRLIAVPGPKGGLSDLPMNTATGRAANRLETREDQIAVFDACYPLKRAARVGVAPNQAIVHAPFRLEQPVRGWAAVGTIGDRENNGIGYLRREITVNARWTPILETFDRYGRARGPAAGVLLNYGGYFAGSNWAFVGIENVDLFDKPDSAAAEVLAELAKFLVRGTYLREVATDLRMYEPGERATLSATIGNTGAAAVRGEVRFIIRRSGETEKIGSATVPFAVEPGGTATVRSEPIPVPDEGDLFSVEATLYVDGGPIDALRTGFLVRKPEIVRSGMTLRFANNYLRCNNRPLFLFGADETAYIYLSPQENPLTWSRDLSVSRDYGMLLYENLQYNNPGHSMEKWDWRNFLGFDQLAQKHRMIFMPGLLVVHNVAVGDATLDEEAKQCADYAERFRKSPGLLYYLNGDYVQRYADEPEAIRASWNAWLKERYGTRAALETAWGAEAVAGDLGTLEFPPKKSNRWNDVVAIDEARFERAVVRRWNETMVRAVRDHDKLHPTTAEYYPAPLKGIDTWSTIDGIDVANTNVVGSSHTKSIRDMICFSDMRLRGKGLSVGEYGIRVHPAWTKEGGPTVLDGGLGYSMATSEMLQKRVFLDCGHFSLGLGACKLHAWCLRDAQARSTFPWGLFYPEQMVPKDVAYAHRNMSLLWRTFALKDVTPRVAVCLSDGLRVGNDSRKAFGAALRSISGLFAGHYRFAVINDSDLDSLPEAVDVLIYPSPFVLSDETFGRLRKWVERGGNLLITGDISFDANRRNTRPGRLESLCGVSFSGRNYADIDRAAGKEVAVPIGKASRIVRPCIDVRPGSATVLSRAEDGNAEEGRGVLFLNRLGKGSVTFFTDPIELSTDPADGETIRAVYDAFLQRAAARPIPVSPNDSEITILEQPTETGTVRVLSNGRSGDGSEEIVIPLGADALGLRIRNGWPGLAMTNKDHRLLALNVDGTAHVAKKPVVSGEGMKMLLSLDGKDLRQSDAFLIAPLESGTVVLPPRAGDFTATIGDFDAGRWTVREQINLGGEAWSIPLNEDRATCITLICPTNQTAEWGDHLTKSMTHPSTAPRY